MSPKHFKGWKELFTFMYYIYDLLLFIYFDISIMPLNIQTTYFEIKWTSVCLYISEQHQSVYFWTTSVCLYISEQHQSVCIYLNNISLFVYIWTTHHNSSLSRPVVILVYTTGSTWYKILYQHTIYVNGMYQSQYVDTDNITWWDQRKNVQYSGKSNYFQTISNSPLTW
jgi:hypothetical protein